MVNRDAGNAFIPILDRGIVLFVSQSSGHSNLFGVSPFYERSPLRLMLQTGASQPLLSMIQGLIPLGVGFYTPSQAGGHAGIYAAITNHMTEMSEREGRPVTRAEAHYDFGRIAGNRRVETAGTFQVNLGRNSTTMSEAAAEGGTASAGIPRTGAISSTILVLDDRNAGRIYYSLTDPAMSEKMVNLRVFGSVITTQKNMKRLKDYASDGEFKLKAATKGRGKKSDRGACGWDMPANLSTFGCLLQVRFL